MGLFIGAKIKPTYISYTSVSARYGASHGKEPDKNKRKVDKTE